MIDDSHQSVTPANQKQTAIGLPEVLRQQYLSAMGIQTWFDPTLELIVSENLVQKIDTAEQNTVLDEKTLDTSSNEKSAVALDTFKNDSFESCTSNIIQCQLCELHASGEQPMCGEGCAQADLLIVIDAPVKNENNQAVLFSDADKPMLLAMLNAIGQDLSSVYLTSLVKCKPPEDRVPYTSEVICCDEHLSLQIKLIQPKLILILGESASQQLLVSQKGLIDLRLRQHQHLGVPVYASYHPKECYSSIQVKRKVWQDLLQISKHLTK